MLQRRRRR